LTVPLLAQNVLTVDNSGNLTASGALTGLSVSAEAGVAGGTYSSGLTVSGSSGRYCLLSLSAPVGSGATANVYLTGTTTVPVGAALVMQTSGQGYTSAPIQRRQPSPPSAGHGRIWFSNATDWAFKAPMGIDQGNNFSAMVSANKGAASGAYVPYYWGVGNAAPASTWHVYDATAVSIGPATPTGTVSGSLNLISSGSYTGSPTSLPVTYCVALSSSSNYTWGTTGCSGGGSGPVSGCVSGTCNLSNNVKVQFSANTGTSGQMWNIVVSPGGTTGEVIQAGISQNSNENLWTVEGNAGSAAPLWGISSGGDLLGYGSGTTNAVTIHAPTGLSSPYNFNLPTAAGSSGQVLTSGGGGSAVTAWNTLSATNITAGILGVAYGGTGADLNSTGGTSQVLKQTSTGAAVSVAQLACGDLSNAATSCSVDATNANNVANGTLGVSYGGTGANLSSTGGANHVLKQTSTGAARLAWGELESGRPPPFSRGRGRL
jgi:hypothetical protein